MKKFTDARSGFGTKEWAEHNFNIGSGCMHDCLYCYARQNALRYGVIKDANDWKNEKITVDMASKKFKKYDGVVMFPTQHDITPNNVYTCVACLNELLVLGNHVLIVSKPHLECVDMICGMLKKFKDQILFRFTIGSTNKDACAFWEPGAPTPSERIDALKMAYAAGYATSVSAEPMLGGYDDAVVLYDAIAAYITVDIWFGKMNFPRQRVDISKPENIAAVEAIEKMQDDPNILKLYERFKDDPLVSWKESIKKNVGL